MKDVLERLHCEWWQALLLCVVLRMYPIFKAIAAILVGRCINADLAKIALPLILGSKWHNDLGGTKHTPKETARR